MYLQIGGRSIKRNRFIAVEHAQGNISIIIVSRLNAN